LIPTSIDGWGKIGAFGAFLTPPTTTSQFSIYIIVLYRPSKYAPNAPFLPHFI